MGADVPPGDIGGIGQRRGDQSRRYRHGLRQFAGGLEGLPRPRQPRQADRLHWSLAGRGHAHQAPAGPGRPLAASARADGLGHHLGRQRPGAKWEDRRRQLQEHPDLQLGVGDGLRHCLFEFRVDTSPQLVLRPPRSRRQPAVGTDEHDRSTGGVRQPGHLLAEGGRPAALLPNRDRQDEGRAGADPLGDVPRSLHRPVPPKRRCLVVAGEHEHGRRRPRPRVSATLGPTWGYHEDDVNLALGNLVVDVSQEEAAYHR